MPEPSPLWPPESICNLTTLGITLAATCSTEPAGRLAAGLPDRRLGHSGCAAAEWSD